MGFPSKAGYYKIILKIHKSKMGAHKGGAERPEGQPGTQCQGAQDQGALHRGAQ